MHGRAVQVDTSITSCRTRVHRAWVHSLTLTCDEPVSNFASGFNLRRYSTALGGSGKNLGAFVYIATGKSINYAVFSYLPPTVPSIEGNLGTLGGLTTITGTNFGKAGATELVQSSNGVDGIFGVTIGGKECTSATVTDDTVGRCRLKPVLQARNKMSLACWLLSLCDAS